MRVILTGATGVVTLLTRRAIPSWAVLPPNAYEKTQVILHNDFQTYPPELAKGLAAHDALIWALGKSSLGMSEAQYTEMTYTYTMNAAAALKDAGAGSPERPFRFVFLSGSHADPNGESRQMWANVKGRVERELPALLEGSNMRACIYRPGYFFPSDTKEFREERMRQRGFGLRLADHLITPIYANFVPKFYTPVEELGRATIELAKNRWLERDLFTNAEMRELMSAPPPPEGIEVPAGAKPNDNRNREL
uniref:Aspartate aminotransferase (EC) n=1 Tax=Ganoderma boninense TaxID=34458 RepID=A0A5K1K4C4_9APHY|nr:Aspartate aminotransferase (EC [Ganoderma boninense]